MVSFFGENTKTGANSKILHFSKYGPDIIDIKKGLFVKMSTRSDTQRK